MSTLEVLIIVVAIFSAIIGFVSSILITITIFSIRSLRQRVRRLEELTADLGEEEELPEEDRLPTYQEAMSGHMMTPINQCKFFPIFLNLIY